MMWSNSDREMLKLAAKAAGIDLSMMSPYHADDWIGFWNPLVHDGDALRLACKCNLSISRRKGAVFVVGDDYICAQEDYGVDPYAATLRAIVRAAAEIGKHMKRNNV